MSDAEGAEGFQAVVDRLKRALEVETNKEVAEALGLTSSNLGERKARGALPHKQIDELIERMGLNPKWVYEAKGSMRLGSSPDGAQGAKRPPVDIAVWTRIVEAVELALDERGARLPAAQKVRLYRALYDMNLPGGRVNKAALDALLTVALGSDDRGR